MHKVVVPKLELWIPDKFNERDEQSPRMGSIDNQPFEQNPRDLLLNCFRVGLGKQVQQSAAEIVGVTVRISQLIGYSVQEQISP
jgi:hypothetical protein